MKPSRGPAAKRPCPGCRTGKNAQPLALASHPDHRRLAQRALVFTFAPEAEGHGTDSVIAAYHYRHGQIRPRVPLIKIVASALTIGSGGSGGREGPIAQIGAGFGSLLGNLLRLRAAERRVLMAAGMGAGIGAIFRAPLAGTIFAAEVLYRSTEFESEVILPAGLATVVSYCIYGLFSGWEPLFKIPVLTFDNPWRLGPYWFWPSLWPCWRPSTRTPSTAASGLRPIASPQAFPSSVGAFLTGLLGVVLFFLLHRNTQVLAVLAFGYSAIQGALDADAKSAGAGGDGGS